MKINPLARFAVERRVTMWMAVLGVMVLGWISLTRLPLEFMPTFSSSNIRVQANYDSSSPDEVERLIVRPLEDSLATITGVDTLTANASANSGSISLNFDDGVDMDMAAVEVRDRIDRVRHLLPDDLERVTIRRFQSTDIPVLRFHVTATEGTRDALYNFIENVLQRRLERLEGVAQVDVSGLRTRQLQVNLNPDLMRARGVDVRQLATALRANNFNLSGGYITEGSRKLLVRVVGEFEATREILELPLNGQGLRLQDVADVDYAYPTQTSFNFLNGNEALTIGIYKASTANLLAVVDRVKAELEELETHPQAAGLTIRYLMDSSTDVRNGLGQLRNAGIAGGVFAIGFLFLFLRRIRTTVLVAIAIPISIVLTFVIMYFLRQAGMSDITINIVSLMGLMLAVGMLVDNSIVVIESIFRHHEELGEDAKTAALRGTSEVALPIITSTITTICVFLPVIFLATTGGGFMRFFLGIGITICIVMVSSLLVALTVVPMAAAVLLRAEAPKPAPLMNAVTDFYGRTIAFTLHHRFTFFLSIVAMLYGSWVLFGTIERTFSPRTMERQISINVDTPRRYSVEQAEVLFDEVMGILDANRERLSISDISHRYSLGGGRTRAGGMMGGGGRGKRIEIYLADEETATLSVREIRDQVRALLPVKAGVDFSISQSRGHGGGGSFGVQVQLAGDDMQVLELIADNVMGELAQVPWLRDLDTSLESGDEEVYVEVNRERALQAGLSTQAIAQTVNNALSSRPVSRIKTPQREVDLVMQYREEDRQTLDQLKNLPVFTADTSLPISALADFRTVEGPRAITREDRQPRLTITANTSTQGTSARMTTQLQSILDGVSLPPGYEWTFGRSARFAQQDMAGAGFALLFAALLIYLIMAALFESFVQPFTIMFSIPFAFIGVGIVLRLTNQPLDNMSNLGLIILIGVVVNNAIVLIHHINQLREQGMSREEAIIQGGRHRFRPIVMTALTTMLGLLPMVAPLFFPGLLGSVEGRAGNWAPVGLVILAGLTTSTFLTLVIVPTIYSLVDEMALFFRRVARTA